MIAVNGRDKRAKNHPLMRQLSDFAASQRNPKTLRNDLHERGFKVRVLNDPGDEAARLAGRNQPLAEARVRTLGHADEEFLLERRNVYALLFGHRVVGGQNHHDFMAGDGFPLKIPVRVRGAQPDETEIDLSRLEGAELFGRRHVEQV